jgi:hypothetical protein
VAAASKVSQRTDNSHGHFDRHSVSRAAIWRATAYDAVVPHCDRGGFAVLVGADLCAALSWRAAWLDPEFEAEVGHPLGLNPQQFVSYILLFLLAVAVGLAVWMP